MSAGEWARTALDLVVVASAPVVGMWVWLVLSTRAARRRNAKAKKHTCLVVGTHATWWDNERCAACRAAAAHASRAGAR